MANSKPTSKPTSDAVSLLLGTTSPAAPKKAAAAPATAKPATTQKEKLKPFSSQISESNEKRLGQYLYHRPGRDTKTKVFNEILKAFFDQYPQYSDQPIPGE